MPKSIFLIFFLLIFNIGFAQDIVINEIMSSNGSTIIDDFGDYSDWVEIYNNSSQLINIHSWCLSDVEDDLGKWQFPDTTIFPNTYILIFCSSRDTLSAYLHANFKLKSSGEYIFLSDENENIIDQYDPVNLGNDISFGRKTDGSDEKTFFYQSSPGSTNNNNLELNEIIFSHDAGFYETSINLSLALQNNIGQIYFTLNGNEPHPDSSGTFIYEDPLSLGEIQNTPAVYSYVRTTPENNPDYFSWSYPTGEIEKHVIIRARIYNNSQGLSNIYTNTYFIGPDIDERFTLPVLSIITDSISLFSYDSGIYLPGKHYVEGVVKSGNYFEKGEAWEKKSTIEYFSENGDQLYEQDLGIRIHGNLTRSAPQKPLQYFPRRNYDGNEKLNYPFFEERPFTEYKRIISRSIYSGHHLTIVRDEIVQDIAKNLNLIYQQWQPAITFINGEYWGIQVLREKLNEHYIKQYFDIDTDSVDIIDLWGVVENGDDIEHSHFLDYTENTDFSIPENYEVIKTMIDIPAYIDYNITEIFVQNMDWPGNNYTKWREKGEDNKWRWFLYDLDASMTSAEHNSLRRAAGDTIETVNPDWSTRLFKSMLQNDEFSDQFLSRFVYLLNNDFSPENTIPIVDKWESIIEHEVENTIFRWNLYNHIYAWQAAIQDIREFLVARPCSLKYHLEAYFNVDSLNIPCENFIPGNPIETKLDIYPNPVTNTLYVFSTNEIISWEIYNMTGASVIKKSSDNRFYEQIDVSRLSKGIYAIIVFDGNYEYTKKIIKR